MSTTLLSGTVTQKSGAVLTARVQDQDGTDLVQSSLSSITYTIFDNSVPTLPEALSGYTDLPLVITSVVYNSLQTPSGGGLTSQYNFRHILAAAAIADTIPLRVEYKFVPTSGEQLIIAFNLQVIPMYTE